MELRGKLLKVRTKLASALRSSDSKKVVEVVDEIISEIPEAEPMFGLSKLTALMKLDEQEKCSITPRSSASLIWASRRRG